jgi:hypothetical protein
LKPLRDNYISNLTVKELRHALRYEPKTGRWFWKNPHYKRIKPGTETGKPNRGGCVTITYKGTQYIASRLAWLYMTGKWPTKDIDHKNRDRNDTRWRNLREATLAQNRANSQLGFRIMHKTGVKGVSPSGKKFVAKLGHTYLGTFATLELARSAYLKEAKKRYGEFARAA